MTILRAIQADITTLAVDAIVPMSWFRERFDVLKNDVLRASYGANPFVDNDQVITSISWISRVEDARDSLLRLPRFLPRQRRRPQQPRRQPRRRSPPAMPAVPISSARCSSSAPAPAATRPPSARPTSA